MKIEALLTLVLLGLKTYVPAFRDVAWWLVFSPLWIPHLFYSTAHVVLYWVWGLFIRKGKADEVNTDEQ